MAISETALEYLHPHVVSAVTSETLTTVNDESDVSFFYAIAAEKGLDNRTQVMSSAAQFINEYGEPNMKKYGQAGHNIINLLNAGANVYVLRVLPGDATYAHAFLNVQTKVTSGTKNIKNVNGEIIKKDDVFLRACTAYSELTATSKESLENQLGITRNAATIDGYTDNLLFVIYPIGRGEAYNNLGFRINLNSSYDDMYDFRVYTFEIIEYDEYDNATTVEGPYYVSLYPDALSYNGDSMFISDVLSTYSSRVRCSFNEDTFYNLARLINDEVHPQVVDVLTGQSRLVAGQPETYYDNETLKYEDVHLALRKYDINGDLVLNNGLAALNISDATDEAELTTIEIDNSLRQTMYNSSQLMLEKMQIVLGEILQKKYGSQLESLIRVDAILGDDTIVEDALIYDVVGGTYKLREDELDLALHRALQAIFVNEVLPSQLLEGELTNHVREVFDRNRNGYFEEGGTAILSERDQTLVICLENLIRVLENIIPYINMMEKSTGYVTIGATVEKYVETWKNILNSTESFVYTLTSMQSALLNLQEELIYTETIRDAKEKLSAVANLFSELSVQLFPNLTVGVNNIDKEFNHYVTKVEKGAELFTNVGAAGMNMENALMVVDKVLDLENSVEGQLIYYFVDKKGEVLKDEDGKYLIRLGERFILKDDPRIEGLNANVGDYVVPGQYIEVRSNTEGHLLVVEEVPEGSTDALISISDPMISGKGFEVGDFVKLVYNALETHGVYPFNDMHDEIENELRALSEEINNLSLTYLTDAYIFDQLNGFKDPDTNEVIVGIVPRMLEAMNKMVNLIDPVAALFAFSKHYSIIDKYALLSAFGAGCRTSIIKGVYKCMQVYLENYHRPESATSGTMNQILANANQAIVESEAKLENLKTYILVNILEGSGTIYRLSKGNDGNISYNNSLIDGKTRHANINNLLVRAYKGLIDENIVNKRLMQFKYLLDANYDVAVKNAMVDLVTNIRKDLFLWLDTEICANPTQALTWRANKFPVATNAAAIYSQDGIVFDEYQGKDVRVSMSYALASMIPNHALNVGLQYPMAGNARGAVSLPNISYIPNEMQKEEMYNRQINYVETNGKINKFGSQLTATSKNDALVNINNMLTVLDIKRNVEIMAEDVLFEFNEAEVISNFQQAINNFLVKYTNNKSCESISASVYSSDYDKTQKILRVSISVSFFGVIERVIININVVK